MGKKRKRKENEEPLNKRNVIEKQEQAANEPKENQGSGSIGYVYNQALALYILLRAFKVKACDFEFAQEQKYVKLFDDIVIRSKITTGRQQIPYCFMQLKYKENPEKTDNIETFLFNENISKYYNVFCEIKSENQFDNLKAANFMLITNMRFKDQQENGWESVDIENDVFFNINAFKLFKLKFDPNANIIIKMKNKIKDVDRIEEFFSQFLVVKTVDYDEIYKLIDEELLKFIKCNCINVDIIQKAFQMKMFERASLKEERIFKDKYYWKTKIDYFVDGCAKMILDQRMEETKIKFEAIHFKSKALFDVSKLENGITNIVTPHTTRIARRRLYCSLREDLRENTIFVEFGTDPNLILRGFSHPSTKILVLYQETKIFEILMTEIFDLVSNNDKGVVIISKEKIDFKSECRYIDGTTSLADLEDLELPGKIIFQGNEIDFNTWTDDFKEIIKDDSLEQLFDGKHIKIGTGWIESSTIFIERELFSKKQTGELKLLLNSSAEDNLQFVNKRDKKIKYSIDIIFDRIVLVSAGAGMGKTYLMKHIARTSTHIDNWVILLELGKLTGILDNWKMNKITITIENAKQFVKDVALDQNQLEERLFDKYLESGKVTILVDAFDEICSTYVELVSNLLKIFSEMNFKSIWITTRPYNIKESLESKLSLKAYELLPFNNRMYTKFFRNHFEKNPENFDETCFKLLINSLEENIGEDILTLPIHCDMILQMLLSDDLNNISEFNDDKYQENLSKLTDRSLLYERFFEKKLYFQYVDKLGNPAHHPGNAMNIQILKKVYEKKFMILALQALLNEAQLEELNITSELDQDVIEEIERGDEYGGFVERIIGGIPKFVHKTYAEFLAAKYLAEKMFKNDKTVTKFLSGIVCRKEYKEIWSFFDEMVFRRSENCELHKMIKNRDFNTNEKYINSASKFNFKDCLGRSILSIVALYVKYPNFVYYFDLLADKVDMQSVDRFGHTTLTYFLLRNEKNIISNTLLVYPDSFVDLVKYKHVNTIRDIIVKGSESKLFVVLYCIFKELLTKRNDEFIDDLAEPIIKKIADVKLDENILIMLISNAFKLFTLNQKYRLLKVMVEENCFTENFEALLENLRLSAVSQVSFDFDNEIKIIKSFTFKNKVYAEYFLSDFLANKIKLGEQRSFFQNIMFKEKFEKLVKFVDILLNEDIEFNTYLILTGFSESSVLLHKYIEKRRPELSTTDVLSRNSLMLYISHVKELGMLTHSMLDDLIIHGTDVNTVDFYGNTALKYAAKKRKYSLCELILWYFPGDVCLDDIVHSKNNEEVKELLLEIVLYRRNVYLLTDCVFASLVRLENVNSNEAVFEVINENLSNIRNESFINIIKNIKKLLSPDRLLKIVNKMIVEDCSSESFDDVVKNVKYSSMRLMSPENIQDQSYYSFVERKFTECFAALYMAEAIKLGDKNVINIFHKMLYDEMYKELIHMTNILILNNEVTSKLHLQITYSRNCDFREQMIDKYFLKNGTDVLENLDILNRTPLMLAAFYSTKYIVKYLLKYNSNVDSADILGYNVFHYALINNKYRNAEIVLLYLPEDVNMDKLFRYRDQSTLNHMLHIVLWEDCFLLMDLIIKYLIKSQNKVLIDTAFHIILSNIHRISNNCLIILMKNATAMFSSEQLCKIMSELVEHDSSTGELTIENLGYFAISLMFPEINLKKKFSKTYKFTNEKFKSYCAAEFIVEGIEMGKQELIALFQKIVFNDSNKCFVKFIDLLLTYGKDDCELLHLLSYLNYLPDIDQISVLNSFLRKNRREKLNKTDILNRTPLMLIIPHNYNCNYELLKNILFTFENLQLVDIFGNKAIDYAINCNNKMAVDAILNCRRS